MRNTFADVIYDLGKSDPRLCIVVADISAAGSMAKFRTEYPDRFINTGVAEQIMIGMCAGMSLVGLRPFAYTIATFTLFRPFEFVRDDLCYQNLPVTIVGVGGGVIYSTLGATHHAMEDIAVAGAIPNMQIIAPCDPDEAAAATRHCAVQDEGPLYLRLGKAGEATLGAEDSDPWTFGKLRYLRRGRDVCILTYGVITHLAEKVANELSADGTSVSLVSCHTLKPLDVEGIKRALKDHKRIIVIEESVPQGGLAAQTKQIAWDCGVENRLDTFTLRDEFIHCYGSHEDILRRHGLSVDQILNKVS